MSEKRKNNTFNSLKVTYTTFPKDIVFYRSINSINKFKGNFNPCIRGIFVSNKNIACKYAELLGKTKEKKVYKYTVTQDINVVNINWSNINIIVKFLKNIDTLSLRNSVTITSRDALNIIKTYLTYKKNDKKLMLNPTETLTINTVKIKVADWFSNIMAYFGFNGYLIANGFSYSNSNSKHDTYPPEVHFCFPRLHLEYNIKTVKCNKFSEKFEPYIKAK